MVDKPETRGNGSDTVPEMEPIVRIQENILAASERRLLNAICARLPGWVTPDMLTGIGMLGALAVFAGYVGSNADVNWLWLAIAGYIVQWFGDSTDGSLARFRKIERPRYGYFLDHSCDGLATTLIVLGIGLTPYIRFDLALISLVGYLLLFVNSVLSVRVLGEMKLSYFNAGPTELRFVLIALTLAMMWFGTGPGWFEQVSGFDLFVGGAGALMILMFVMQTALTARRLAGEDPPPNRK